MKRNQGRVTERSRNVREEKKGKELNSFHGNVCADLTCRLMGDPVPDRRAFAVLAVTDWQLHAAKDDCVIFVAWRFDGFLPPRISAAPAQTVRSSAPADSMDLRRNFHRVSEQQLFDFGASAGALNYMDEWKIALKARQ